MPSKRTVSSSFIDFLSVSSTSLRQSRLRPAVSERMGFNKDLSRHPPSMTALSALQPPSQTSAIELKAPPRIPLHWHLTRHKLRRSPPSSLSFHFQRVLFYVGFFVAFVATYCRMFSNFGLRLWLMWKAQQFCLWLAEYSAYPRLFSLQGSITCGSDEDALLIISPLPAWNLKSAVLPLHLLYRH